MLLNAKFNKWIKVKELDLLDIESIEVLSFIKVEFSNGTKYQFHIGVFKNNEFIVALPESVITRF